MDKVKNIYKPQFNDEHKAIIALVRYYEKKIQSTLNSLFNDDYKVEINVLKDLE